MSIELQVLKRKNWPASTTSILIDAGVALKLNKPFASLLQDAGLPPSRGKNPPIWVASLTYWWNWPVPKVTLSWADMVGTSTTVETRATTYIVVRSRTMNVVQELEEKEARLCSVEPTRWEEFVGKLTNIIAISCLLTPGEPLKTLDTIQTPWIFERIVLLCYFQAENVGHIEKIVRNLEATKMFQA